MEETKLTVKNHNNIDVPEGDAIIMDEEREKRLATIWNLKMRGASVPAIAKSLAVSSSTIYRDLRELGQRYREEIIQADPITLIAEHLHWLDEMETVALHEVATASKKVQKLIDSATGTVTEVEVMDPNKSKFHSAALKARDMKIKLMMDTGIIPRNEPQKMFNNLKQHQASEEVILKEERTDEEIKESIADLLRRGRRMGESD